MDKPHFEMYMMCPHCKTTDRVTVESIEYKPNINQFYELEELMNSSVEKVVIHYYCDDCGSRGSRRDGQYEKEISISSLVYEFEKYVFNLMTKKTNINLKTSLALGNVAKAITKEATVIENNMGAVETIIRYENRTGE